MELPELTILARQMTKELTGKRISEVEVANPKCLNMPLEQFQKTILGKTIKAVEGRGKWLFIKLDSDHLLLFNPGMGADVMHFKPEDKMPEVSDKTHPRRRNGLHYPRLVVLLSTPRTGR